MDTFPIERLRELASFYQFKLFFADEEYAELLDKFCGIEESIEEYAYVLSRAKDIIEKTQKLNAKIASKAREKHSCGIARFGCSQRRRLD